MNESTAKVRTGTAQKAQKKLEARLAAHGKAVKLCQTLLNTRWYATSEQVCTSAGEAFMQTFDSSEPLPSRKKARRTPHAPPAAQPGAEGSTEAAAETPATPAGKHLDPGGKRRSALPSAEDEDGIDVLTATKSRRKQQHQQT